MSRIAALLCFVATFAVLSAFPTPLEAAETPKPDGDGFISLFDGKSLDGWHASEHPDSFTLEDGVIKVNGERGHLFYEGPVKDHDFKNFELKVEVKTEPNSNAGVYFHTEFEKEGWPSKGFECQVNNTFVRDPIKTGSLYKIKDVHETKAKDGEWFDYDIKVEGKHVVLKVNGETTVDFTEPETPAPPADMKGRVISHGTIALQAHDPGSTVRFRNIRIKPLP